MIRFSDVDVPRAAIAELAARLRKTGDTALSHRLALAIDKNVEELRLTPEDYWPIIRLLDEQPIASLEEFHRTLRERQRAVVPPIGPARERRMAENEVFFRQINERLEERTSVSAPLVVLCECADEDCTQRLTLTHSEYEAVRLEATQFVVAHGHADAEIEVVVRRTDRFEVVRKKGLAAAVAELDEAAHDEPV